MWPKKLVACVLIVAMAGCGNGPTSTVLASATPGTGSTTGATAAEAAIPKAATPSFVGVLSLCPSSATKEKEAVPAVAAILVAVASTVVPAVVSTVTKWASNWLNGQAADHNASSTAIANWQLWGISQDKFVLSRQCLVFVRGDFSSSSKASAESSDLWAVTEATKLNDQLTKDGYQVALKGAPELYMEFPIEYEKTKSKSGADVPVALTLRPAVIKYLKSGAKAGSKNEKKLVVEIKFTAEVSQGNNRTQQVLFDQPFDFGQVQIPSSVDSGQLATKQGARTALVYPFVIKGLIVERPKAGAKADDSANDIYDLVHMTSSVVVTESDSGGDVERAFATAISDSSPGISKGITDAVTSLLQKPPAQKPITPTPPPVPKK